MQITIQLSGLPALKAKFQDFQEKAPDFVTQAMLDSANENIIVAAKALAPKRTGALAGSIEALPGEQPMQILISTDRFYAPFLEFGTRAHIIRARNARALHWTKGGVDYFAKSVRHPGIQPGKFSFIGPAIEEGLDKLVQDVSSKIEEQLQL